MEKSQGVRSGERMISKTTYNPVSKNLSQKAKFSWVVCAVAPSCWNQP
jgi:hypothetical protein